MLYEIENSLSADMFKIMYGTDITFPTHLHNSFEFVTVTEGEMIISVEKKEYKLHTGGALLIFPNQAHAYTTENHSKYTVCIFSPELVKSYSNIFSKNLPKSNLFVSKSDYSSQLSEASNRSILSIKGILYSLCGEFHENAEYERKQENSNNSLIEKIFKFVEKNYDKECTLTALSKELSYHCVYLSRCFKGYTGMTFIDYVNHYRVNEASYILKNTDLTSLQVAFASGFDSLRNFNRVFKKITGKTPSEYRILK